jgi:hypothetical protein
MMLGLHPSPRRRRAENMSTPWQKSRLGMNKSSSSQVRAAALCLGKQVRPLAAAGPGPARPPPGRAAAAARGQRRARDQPASEPEAAAGPGPGPGPEPLAAAGP